MAGVEDLDSVACYLLVLDGFCICKDGWLSGRQAGADAYLHATTRLRLYLTLSVFCPLQAFNPQGPQTSLLTYHWKKVYYLNEVPTRTAQSCSVIAWGFVGNFTCTL